MKLEIGEKTKSGFVLTEKINSLDSLYNELMNSPSVFARHKMYASGFVVSMQLKTVQSWINRGWFFKAKKEEL